MGMRESVKSLKNLNIPEKWSIGLGSPPQSAPYSRQTSQIMMLQFRRFTDSTLCKRYKECGHFKSFHLYWNEDCTYESFTGNQPNTLGVELPWCWIMLV